MKKIIYISAILVVLISGCKDNQITAPVEESNYSGKYQNQLYNDSTVEPNVILNLTQKGNALTGTGNFNGIAFSFTGTLSDCHALISFDLMNTNVGDLRNCIIDGYFGDNKMFAGGYTLSYQWGTEKIRFKQVANAE